MKLTKDLRNFSGQELENRLGELNKELLKLRVGVASGANTSNPGKSKQVKKNIARILTLLKEKETEVRLK